MSKRQFGRHTVETSSEDKVLFPDCGLTKGDLIAYYERIADTMLPHVEQRALTLHRAPDGLEGETFFQKQAGDYFPDWLERANMKKEGGTVNHATCSKTADFVYLANQACITLHASLSRIDKPHHPDRLVFDLDPSSDDFDQVIQAARLLRERVEDAGLAAFTMTTGSKGLHVVCPLRRDADFDQVRKFARTLAKAMADDYPNALTMEQRRAKRGNRVYLDVNRNAYGQTAVAPYSVRLKPGAPIATPCEWNELNGDLRPDKYSITNIFRRLARKDDPWNDISSHARTLPQRASTS